MNARELVEECYRLTGMYRTDLYALAEFVEARASGQLNSMNAIHLFWETWKPRVMVTVGSDPIGYTNEEPPTLPEDIEEAFLEILAELEREYKVDYETDSESAIDFEAASLYVHVGAASALRHVKRSDLSNDVIGAMLQVQLVLQILKLRALRYLGREGESPHAIQSGIDDGTLHGARTFGLVWIDNANGEVLTLWGVRCLVLGTVSKQNYAEAKYEDAFRMAGDAFRIAEDISEAVHQNEENLLERGVVEDDFLEEDREIRSAVRRCTPLRNIEPQQVVDAFEGLKIHGVSGSWRWVVDVCDSMAWHDREDFELEVVLDGDKKTKFWSDYWNAAKGWAEAQLSPNEYRELRRQDERGASEGRLKRYFFGDNWSNWPQKTRERLINLDTLWFSESKGLDFGTILNDLQVAVESMCYEFIWEPLRKGERGQEFKRKEAEFSGDSNSPTLADYRWICGRSFFKGFVEGAQLAEEDRRFLLQRLPRSLKRLYDSRNRSQHDPGIRLQRQDVEPFVREFFGIGQPGVLRRLAEIGPKLARR